MFTRGISAKAAEHQSKPEAATVATPMRRVAALIGIGRVHMDSGESIDLEIF
jgi:hypothetical protein